MKQADHQPVMDLECRQHPPDPIAAQNRQSGPNQCSGQNHRCTIIGVQVTPSQSEMARWPSIVTHLSALNKVWHGASNRQRDLRKDKSKILSCTSFDLFTDGRMQSCTFPTGIPVHTNFCSWVSTLTTLSTGYLESTMFPLSSENNHIWENYHLLTESDSQHV